MHQEEDELVRDSRAISTVLDQLVDNAAQVRCTWPFEPQLHHGDADALSNLISIDYLNRLIDTNCLNPRLISLIKHGQPLNSLEYSKEGHLIRGAVRRHLSGGATLSMRALHETFPSCADICKRLAQELGHPTQANCYLTPIGGQGFAHHWDPHITVIAQIAGEKVWELYAPMVADPVYPQFSWTTVGFTPDQRMYLADNSPDYTVMLRPGDVLWVPRGWIHNPYTPETSPSPSLHVTIGIVQRTFHWLALKLLEASVQNAGLRKAIPPGESFRRADTVKEAWEILNSWFKTIDPAEIATNFDLSAEQATGLILPTS